jgi:hypothetical protein
VPLGAAVLPSSHCQRQRTEPAPPSMQEKPKQATCRRMGIRSLGWPGARGSVVIGYAAFQLMRERRRRRRRWCLACGCGLGAAITLHPEARSGAVVAPPIAARACVGCGAAGEPVGTVEVPMRGEAVAERSAGARGRKRRDRRSAAPGYEVEAVVIPASC